MAVIASHLVLCLIIGEIQNDGLRHRRKDFLLDSDFKIRRRHVRSAACAA